MDCFYGYVKELKGKRAIIKMNFSPKCVDCGEKGGCAIFAKKEERELEVFNPISAQVGDLVAIDYPEKRSFIILLLFGLPILAILLGAYLGFLFFKKEIYSLLFSFLFLFFSLIISKVSQGCLIKKEEYLPKIKEIIKEEK